ncbi:MAG: DUF2341 domain-containing protein [Candidatus Hodarchaeales archaeon]
MDSTSYGTSGTLSASGVTQGVTGRIGSAYDFDGINGNVNMGDPADGHLDFPYDDFSFSMWVNSAPGGGHQYIIRKGGSSGEGGYRFLTSTDGTEIYASVGDDVNRVNANIIPYNTDVWTYLVVTVNRTSDELAIYANGTLQGSPDDISILNGLNTTYSFELSYSGKNFIGLLDEVRVRSGALLAEWIATEYTNQNDPDSFFSVSSEEENSNHWVDGSFRYRKTIIINSSKVSTDLTNFPFLIDLTDSDLKIGRVQSDADDIIFIDQTGAKLDHEIEQFQQNSSLGRLIAWVRVPSLSSISDTNLTMYYGNSAVNSQENVNGVWNDYEGVWHLNELIGNAKDSTSYNEDGTPSGVTQGVTGQMSSAYSFDTTDQVMIGNPVDGHLDFGTDSFTFSCWLIINQSTGNSQLPIYKGGTSGGTTGYSFVTTTNGQQLTPVVSDGAGNQVYNWSSISFDTWIYSVGVINRSSNLLLAYLDGSEITSDDISSVGSISNSQNLVFSSTSYPFDGILDEVRISRIAHSADWIQTEFDNQYDPTSFISVTSEEVHPYWWADASFGKQKDIVIDKNKVSGDISNFPVLIDIYDSDLRTDVQADAADLMFTDSSNIKLTHEIELFDQTGNGTHAHLIAWVNVPILFNNTDSVISMYYGNSNANPQNSDAGIWDDNYIGVWHLSEEGSGNADEYKDSSIYKNDGQGGEGNTSFVPSRVQGQIGYAQDFNNLDGYYDLIDCGNDSSFNLTGYAITLEAWIQHNITPSTHVYGIMNHKGWYDGYSLWIDQGALKIAFNLPGDTHKIIGTTDVTTNTWHHVVATYDGEYMRVYIDGNLEGSLAKSNAIEASTSEQDFWIGHGDQPKDKVWSGEWEGQIDEVRVSDIGRSGDWIATQYNNQYSPISFYSVGSEYELDTTPPVINDFGVEDPGTGSGTFWADITDAHSGVDSALIKINGTDYSMSSNGTHWIKQLSVEFGKHYEYHIANASDQFGNYITSPSSNKSYTFNLDNVIPDVLDWEYVSGNNTFQANVTDSWGSIDTVIVNVTTHTLTTSMVYYNTFSGTKLAYMNNTLSMPNGPMDFLIFVNDTSGNQFSSTTHSGNVYSNTAPVASNVTLSRDQFQELIPIFSNSTIYLDYEYDDAEFQIEAGTEIRWYKDNGTGYILQTNRNDSDSIPVSALVKGDQWYATVTPKDGEFPSPPNS